MESTFPEWAQEYKKHHNVTLKQQGSSIYVYKKTSKREKGKKNPVTYEKYRTVQTIFLYQTAYAYCISDSNDLY